MLLKAKSRVTGLQVWEGLESSLSLGEAQTSGKEVHVPQQTPAAEINKEC